MNNLPQEEKCYACGRPFRSAARHVIWTIDGQMQFVGPACFGRVVNEGGTRGFQPAAGGPLLFADVRDARRRHADAVLAKIILGGAV